MLHWEMIRTCRIGKTKRACNRCEVHYRCGISSVVRKGALIMKKHGKKEREQRGSGSILVCPVSLAQLTLVYTTPLCPSLHMCTSPATQTTTDTMSTFCSHVCTFTLRYSTYNCLWQQIPLSSPPERQGQHLCIVGYLHWKENIILYHMYVRIILLHVAIWCISDITLTVLHDFCTQLIKAYVAEMSWISCYWFCYGYICSSPDISIRRLFWAPFSSWS